MDQSNISAESHDAEDDKSLVLQYEGRSVTSFGISSDAFSVCIFPAARDYCDLSVFTPLCKFNSICYAIGICPTSDLIF